MAGQFSAIQAKGAMLTCYLDSQDYSTLTDPRNETTKSRELKSTLIDLARSKEVRFCFSAAAVCEAVAPDPQYADLALRKAELITELCGSNALISFDRLAALEVKALENRARFSREEVFDAKGRWFPKIPTDKSPSYLFNIAEMALAEIQATVHSRDGRRKAERALVKNGRPTQLLMKKLAEQDPSIYVAMLMRTYPISPEDKDFLIRCARGRATDKEFSETLERSLADPVRMMQWFEFDYSLASPISDMVRAPGRKVGQLIRSLASMSLEYVEAIKRYEPDSDPTGRNGKIRLQWNKMVEGQQVSMARSMAQWCGSNLGEVTSEDVSAFCPGISTMVRSLYSSVWSNVGEGKKEEPLDSQPVDSIHALYAPYVDVFRADKFMTPHIQREVDASGTVVVRLLSDLVGVLRQQLV